MYDTIIFVPLNEKERIDFFEEFEKTYANIMLNSKVFDTYSESLKKSKEVLKHDAFSEKLHIYNIVSNNDNVGIIWFSEKSIHDPNIAWLGWVYVHDFFKRKGFASKAILKMENLLKSKNIKSIGLNVYANNQSAKNLYDKLGYKIKSIKKHKDGADRSYIMEKNL